jgi:integrase
MPRYLISFDAHAMDHIPDDDMPAVAKASHEVVEEALLLQAIALEAINQRPASRQSALVFPAERGGYLDLHNFRNREWKPAQREAGIEPPRRIYDLRHTFATFALRAGISTFDLSRYMGASLTTDVSVLCPRRAVTFGNSRRISS